MNSWNFSDIKLIIWDLDNTFWSGIISEENITWNSKNQDIIIGFTENGIINSICSKNEISVCKDELSKHSIWDYFVFPSINWEGKGERVKRIVELCQLRPQNVLFVDDQINNIKEVEFLNPEIKTQLYTTEFTEKCIEWLNLADYKDKSCDRLKRYKLLEEKQASKDILGNNDEFLKQSNIRCIIKKDCLSQINRIHELIQRTNQLNYTKKRISLDELKLLLEDTENDCGYIEVSDKFGDYGIIGFYSQRDGKLEHFLFSCRTLGMGIEQYVFMTIGAPSLTVNGSVANEIVPNFMPDWINNNSQHTNNNENKRNSKKLKILIKGPCDVQSTLPYLENLIDCEIHCEFAYVSQKSGRVIKSYNHTSQIIASKLLDKKTKEYLIANLSFIDDEYYKTQLFDQKWDVIIYSCLEDYGEALYTKDNDILSYGCDRINLNSEQGRNLFALEEDPMDENTLSELKNWTYSGREDKETFIENLQQIVNWCDTETTFIFINGSETAYKGEASDFYWATRTNEELIHKEYNEALSLFCQKNKNCYIADINKAVHSNDDYRDSIHHYKRHIYYKMANQIAEIILQTTPKDIKQSTLFHVKNFILGSYEKWKWIRHKIIK